MSISAKHESAQSVRGVADLYGNATISASTSVDNAYKRSIATGGSPDYTLVCNNVPTGLITTYVNGVGMSMFPTVFFYYDFDTDGGTVSTTITLRQTQPIPNNVVIVNSGIWVTTALSTGSSPTIALGVGSDSGSNNLITATATSSIGTAGGHLLVPDFATVGDWVELGASGGGDVKMAIATASLTAGAFVGWLQYIPTTIDTSTTN